IADTITPAAEVYLRDHPLLVDLTERNAAILRDLKAEGAPLGHTGLDLVTDAEIPGYRLLAFTVAVDAGWDATQRWQHEITLRRMAMEASLSAKARMASPSAVMVWLVPESLPEL